MPDEGRELQIIGLKRETQTAHRGRQMVETKLERIAEVAKQKPNEAFTSLSHYLNKEMLTQCHRELEADKAPGVDRVTKEEYEKNLTENIENLIGRLKKHSYRSQPARRVYIPKESGQNMRPLGLPAYEDKIVQSGINKVLQAIYEQDFLDCSYGFRPKRSQHDALKKLNEHIERGKINYVVDADIRGFFDNVSHDWMMKFLSKRIADPNMKEIILRTLKAGIIEGGKRVPAEKGMPQGSLISPLLGNVYLHYVLDLWFEKVVKKESRGQAELVRFADDCVGCFQYKDDAEKYYAALKERLKEFELEIAEDKSKIIEFGRFAEERRGKQGLGKPETFDFLGFTHYCSKSKEGGFRVKRKTSKKKFKNKVKKFTEFIKQARNRMTMAEIFTKVKQKLSGHYQYYGITDNTAQIERFGNKVEELLYKWMNRRSQRKSFCYEKFRKYLALNPLPKAKIYVNIYGKLGCENGR